MLLTGVFLVIWSDHEGWPVGMRTMRETYFGDDWEMIQHKLFGIMLLAVGSVEASRRFGWLRRTVWCLPLPVLAIMGGLSLFLHSHGAHPAAHKIALHHAVMGTMAVTAGTSKLTSMWRRSHARWELLWGILVVLIGLQLLIYSE
jgi:putative copper resistance protein D